MHALEAIGLTKRFGKTLAISDVSFAMEEGDAVALVGPNGAGKTTLLRLLSTLSKPDGGYATVQGLDGRYEAPEIRRRLGYMPDAFGMYEDLTVTEYLRFFTGIYGLKGETREATLRDLITLLDLDEWKDHVTSGLSRGMQQRVALARTLMHDPSILLLDEPAANLDPRSRIEIRGVLQELRRMGKTILISSHILKELDELCNKILLLDRGHVLFFGEIDEIARRLDDGTAIRIVVDGDVAPLLMALGAEADVADVGPAEEGAPGELRIRLADGVEDFSFVARRALELGLPIRELRREESDLEDVFVRLTQRGPDA